MQIIAHGECRNPLAKLGDLRVRLSNGESSGYALEKLCR
jgi:hypothetical protein